MHPSLHWCAGAGVGSPVLQRQRKSERHLCSTGTGRKKRAALSLPTRRGERRAATYPVSGKKQRDGPWPTDGWGRRGEMAVLSTKLGKRRATPPSARWKNRRRPSLPAQRRGESGQAPARPSKEKGSACSAPPSQRNRPHRRRKKGLGSRLALLAEENRLGRIGRTAQREKRSGRHPVPAGTKRGRGMPPSPTADSLSQSLSLYTNRIF